MQENTLDQSTLDSIMLLSARFYNHAMIKYALENGANINADNCIIMDYVSFVNGTKIFDDLLDFGMDLSLISLRSFTHKLHDHNYDIVKYILDHIGDNIPIIIIDKCICFAIMYGAEHIIKLLLQYDHVHALLPENVFDSCYDISIETLQILSTNDKIDLQIHGSFLLRSVIHDRNVLMFLLENNIKIDNIRFNDICPHGMAQLDILLDHDWRPNINDIIETFSTVGDFIKLVIERGADVYASLEESNIMDNHNAYPCFIEAEYREMCSQQRRCTLSGTPVVGKMSHSFPIVTDYMTYNNFDQLLDHMNNHDLDQNNLNYIFIMAVKRCNNELIDCALKKGADINAYDCECLTILLTDSPEMNKELSTDNLHMLHKFLDLGANPNLISVNAFVKILNDSNYAGITLILEHLTNLLSQDILNLCLIHIIRFDQLKCLELFMLHDAYHDLVVPVSIFIDHENAFAYSNSSIESFEFLLSNSKISMEEHGVTLLNIAVKYGNTKLIDFLLENNVDIKMIDVVSIRSSFCNKESVREILMKLLDNGLVLTTTNISTILDIWIKPIKILLEHDIDVIAILIKN